ncbi:homoserine dehydrogenase [Pilibacter termitis]|uniref:Homoserine dehydrogenase n=1 Tax=Pilibacter termitis TaxID=263852 RepID=A0A1T4QBA6_9ENTE|nr:homoserine dehydrogenase [Pilibacter termitis]SKA01062.1 homoserine dehydrogenase [Pilibacter termitis]
MVKKLKIGLLGLGTVGSGVPLILTSHKEKIAQVTGADIEIGKVLVYNEEEKKRQAEIYPHLELTTDFQEILDDKEIEVVVELIGKIEPAKTYISQALKSGKHVVTANKDLLATHGRELSTIAQEQQVDLYFEASVAGGIPILRTLANSLAADNIEKVLGIVNGTTNYMLTKMLEDGISYEVALKNAQELGFAESDPTNDVDGIDAAYKMIILTNFAFGMFIDFDDVSIRGIRSITMEDVEIATRLGYEIKLIGTSEKVNDSVTVEVAPMLVSTQHPIHAVKNEMNAVFINSSGLGESMYYGPGAGAKPTATAVVSDIITIAKNIRLGITGSRFNSYKLEKKLAEDNLLFNKYYFALESVDRSGQLLLLSKIFAEEHGSVDQLIQQKTNGEMARIVVITHEISKQQLKKITEKISQQDSFKLLNTFKVLEA